MTIRVLTPADATVELTPGTDSWNGIELGRAERPVSTEAGGQLLWTIEAVVTVHHPEIHRYLARVTGRAAEADDLSQETFLRAYRAFRALPEDANVRAWLFTIATNVYRNHVRSEKRRLAAHATVRAAGRELDLDGPEEEAMADEARALTAAAIRQLPPKQRAAIALHYIGDMTTAEVAEILGCAVSTVSVHLHRARARLAETLGEEVDSHASCRATAHRADPTRGLPAER